jgi:hypothetical protein
MKTLNFVRAIPAALIVAVCGGSSTAALADIKDYKFAMQEMATKVTPVPAAEPGTYKFRASFGMEGRWQLSLGAKVQGETGTVAGKFVITAQK